MTEEPPQLSHFKDADVFAEGVAPNDWDAPAIINETHTRSQRTKTEKKLELSLSSRTPSLALSSRNVSRASKSRVGEITPGKSISSTAGSFPSSREYGLDELKHKTLGQLQEELEESTLQERWYANSLQANTNLGCKVLTGGVAAFCVFRVWWLFTSFKMKDGSCKRTMTKIQLASLLLDVVVGLSVLLALRFPRPKLYFGVLVVIALYCGLFSLFPTHITCDESISLALCEGTKSAYKWAAEAECSPQGEGALSLNVVIIITSPACVPHFRTAVYFLCFLIALVGVATVVHRIAFFSYHNGWDCLLSFLLLAGAAAIALRKKFSMERREIQLCIVENRRKHATWRVYYLLKNMVPEFIVPRLLEEPPSLIADSLECVSILFMEVSDFDTHVVHSDPAELLEFLNTIFTRMDSICRTRSVTKIETVGAEYVAAVGITPGEIHNSHQTVLGRLIEVSLDVLLLTSLGVCIRMGIHTGPVVAGVIGYKLPRFRLFGSTINIAARMMQKGADGELQFGEATRKELPAWAQTRCRGAVDMKGLGEVVVYFLDQEATRACKHQDDLHDRQSGHEVTVRFNDAGDSKETATQGETPGRVGSGAVSDPQPVLTRGSTNISQHTNTTPLSRNISSHSLKAVVQKLGESMASTDVSDAMPRHSSHSLSSGLVSNYVCSSSLFNPEHYEVWMKNFYESRRFGLSNPRFGLRCQAILQFIALLVLTIVEVLIAVSEAVFARDDIAKAYFVTRALLLFGLPFSSFVVYSVRSWARERPRLLECWRLLGLCLTTLMFSISYNTIELADKEVYGMSAPEIRSAILSRPYRIRIWKLLSLLFFSTLVINVTLRSRVALVVLVVNLAIMNAVRYIYLAETVLSNLSLTAAEVGACLMAFLFALRDEQNDKRDFKESLMLDITNDRIEGLLKMLLPPMVVDDLTALDVKAPPPSHSYSRASIAQSDLVGFTKLCKSRRPDEVIRIVGDLFGLFDGLTDAYGVYKVETVGDAYIAGQAEQPLTSMNRVVNVVVFALHIIEVTQQWSRDNAEEEVDCRVGVHFGRCVGGIVGRRMRRYHLFGKLLSELELLESTAPPGKVQLSKACWDAVQAQIRRERLPDLVVTATQRQEPLLFTSKNDPIEYDQVGGGPTLIVDELNVEEYPLYMTRAETEALAAQECLPFAESQETQDPPVLAERTFTTV